MKPEQIILEQVITEKALAERSLSRYVFKVHPQATKISVAQAIQQIFKVKVKDVNTIMVRSKRKVVGRSIGRTAHWKKAYVTLAQGQKIEEIEA